MKASKLNRFGDFLAVFGGAIFIATMVSIMQAETSPAGPTPPTNVPATPPPLVMPSPRPAAPAPAAPAPNAAEANLDAPVAPNNPISLRGAQFVQQALDAIAAAKANGSWTGFAQVQGSKHPLLAALLALAGLFRVIGLPIHTFLDNYLQKNLTSEQYGEAKKAGTTLAKQFDWLVNFAFSVKPSMITAANQVRKSKAAADAPDKETLRKMAVEAGLLPAAPAANADAAYQPPTAAAAAAASAPSQTKI